MEVTRTARCSIAEVAIGQRVDKLFHYAVPSRLAASLHPGHRVVVPFGKGRRVGFVVGLVRETGVPVLKEIESAPDEQAVVSEDLLDLARWVADYYAAPLGLVLKTILPPGFSDPEKAFAKEKQEIRVALAPNAPAARRRLTAKQEAVLALLQDFGGEMPLTALRAAGASAAAAAALEKKGLVAFRKGEAARLAHPDTGERDTAIVLSEAQRRAVAEIGGAVRGGTFAPFLLHGVTGSGKTEVYLRLIQEIVREGGGALVLVPEIALTPQLIGRFVRRLGDAVAVLHSGLTDAERRDQWKRLRSGEARVAVGVRSAVFAPVDRLKLIVVDEEHDPSYRQDEGVRYHARDTAVMRAKRAGIPVVLGTATPSLETFHNAREGRYRPLDLPERAGGAVFPTVRIVDLRGAKSGNRFLSPDLLSAVEERLARSEQSLLFLNRRGWASFLLCRECGATLSCDHCSVTLTVHKGDKSARCHYCGHARPLPEVCPACGGTRMAPLGVGTEQIEEELKARFPSARVARMDRDTMGGRGAYIDLVRDLHEGKVDILVGTQMVTKGHHFPRVSLVGVVLAETSLMVPDFRATERTFHLLMQVAGRAGRGEVPGEAIVQTFVPGHPILAFVQEHDFAGFAETELSARREVRYPPFVRLVRVLITGTDEVRVSAAAARGAAAMREAGGKEIEVLGPAPAPLARLKGKFRWHVLLKGKEPGRLKDLARRGSLAIQRVPGASSLSVLIDVDPVGLM
ncbi:MAG: primosomal protein N' [Nitrospirota bacterium]